MKELVLLPGALGASSEFSELASRLNSDFIIHLYDFPGHAGRIPDKAGFSIEAFTNDLAGWLREKDLQKANFFGYSMGGYVALYLASIAPELVGKVATLGTKLAWTEESAAGEQKKLNPEALAEKVPVFAAKLARLHPKDWASVVKGTAQLMTRLGKQPLVTSELLVSLQIPVLLGLGDRDRMVTLQESQEAFAILPQSQLCILPATPHPLDKVSVDLLTVLIKRFF
jgi:pimeloyl-ACP methyl ester carboxylesterase